VLSLCTLVALIGQSNLSPTRCVVASYVPSLCCLFSFFYSRRVVDLNVGGTVPALFILHHAVLLVLVFGLNFEVPGWMLDAPFWFSSTSIIISPTSAMQSWEIDTAKLTTTDNVHFFIQAQSDIMYAAVIRTCLSVSSGERILERLMKWSYTAWCASFVALYALRPDLAKTRPAQLSSEAKAVFLITARLLV
jgi:hypothetical protein